VLNRSDGNSGPASPSRAALGGLLQLIYLTALAVAGFAFTVSYTHIYDLGAAHAQAGVAGVMLPLSVDLLIVAASLVLFRQSRLDERPAGLAKWLPRVVLWSGIAATVAANVAYGLPHGWLAAVISGWPGAAFVGVVEMVMIAVRPGTADAGPRTVKAAGGSVIPASSYEAAKAAVAGSLEIGMPLSEWQVHKRFGMSRAEARKIVASVAGKPSLNGSAPDA
jgi:hypothetical protein